MLFVDAFKAVLIYLVEHILKDLFPSIDVLFNGRNNPNGVVD